MDYSQQTGMALYFYNLPLGFTINELKELVVNLQGVQLNQTDVLTRNCLSKLLTADDSTDFDCCVLEML